MDNKERGFGGEIEGGTGEERTRRASMKKREDSKRRIGRIVGEREELRLSRREIRKDISGEGSPQEQHNIKCYQYTMLPKLIEKS